jgi:hypothetical protein
MACSSTEGSSTSRSIMSNAASSAASINASSRFLHMAVPRR